MVQHTSKAIIDFGAVSLRHDLRCYNCSFPFSSIREPFRISTDKVHFVLCYSCFKELWQNAGDFDQFSSVPSFEVDITSMGELLSQLIEIRLTEVANEQARRSTISNQVDDEIYKMPLFAFGQREPSVEVFWGDFTNQFLKNSITDTNQLYGLNADQFELFICEKLFEMGFEVERTTQHSYIPDGGIDILAWSEKTPLPGLIAVQVKHHSSQSRKVDVSDTREFMGIVLENRLFSTGLITTNTTFTSESRWVASKLPMLIRLRDVSDMARWIKGDFVNDFGIKDLPNVIELGSGIVIPSSRFMRVKTDKKQSVQNKKNLPISG